MKIRWNPIVKKDLKVAVRSMRLSWGLFGYEAVLAVTFLLAVQIIQSQNGVFVPVTRNLYSYLVYLFPVIAVVQVCIVGVYMPVITASSISGEKERQTFDIMLTTCMSPFSIVFGKVMSAVLRILFFVAASLPIMALSFVVGGLSWRNLFYFLAALILFSVFAGSVGILSSALCRKSVSAVLLAFGIYLVIFGGTFVPWMGRMIIDSDKMGESLLPLLFNPILFFEEFFAHMMMGESLFGTQGYRFSVRETGLVTHLLSRDSVWMFVSGGCILALSFLFMGIAAYKVNPLHAGAGRNGKKKGRNA